MTPYKVKCKICNNESRFLFKAKVLSKYNVDYYQCNSCNFIHFDEVYWLNEAYEKSIASNDTGYVTRNLRDAEIVSIILKLFYRKKNSRFLDYGGGYGLFVRMMRDKGFNYFNYDKYSENLFSKFFEFDKLDIHDRFDLISSFEVFEHFVDPFEQISSMFLHTDSVLFSTSLVPKQISSVDDWWYFAPESGQHISFYTKKALVAIAKRLNCRIYSNNKDFHLLTKKRYILNPVLIITLAGSIINLIFGRHFNRRNSFIETDYRFIKDKMHING